MPRPELTVRLQSLGGQWETCGTERLRGIVPQKLTVTANEWGSDTCSFELRRDPGGIYPDLTSYTPCEVEVGGVVVWSGRIRETPVRDGLDAVITVQSQGWQYALDDDVYRRNYVITSLSAWTDRRSHLSTTLGGGNYVAAGQVNNDGGLALMYPNGAALTTSDRVGVFIDAGEGQTVAGLSYDYTGSNNSSTVLFSVWAGDSQWTEAETFSASINSMGASGSSTLTAPNTRYVSFSLKATSGVSLSADVWLKFTGIRVFTSAAYQLGLNSALVASDVVKDARDQGTMLLSSDNSKIVATSFVVPEFGMTDYRTPREVISAVNSYHDNVAMVDVQKRLVFKPKPTSPKLEMGAYSGAEFEDASANSGEDIFNRAIVQAQAPDGSDLAVVRAAGALSGVLLVPVTTPAFANPSFDTNTTGWGSLVTFSAPTRDTSVYESAPASGQFFASAGSAAKLSTTTTGTFKAGRAYRIDLRVYSNVARSVKMTVSAATASYTVALPLNTWTTVSLYWTPRADTVGPAFYLETFAGPPSSTLWVDTGLIYESKPTLVDRRNFQRTKVLGVSSPLTTEAANQIGDVYLSGHKTTPLRGSVRVLHHKGVRTHVGGQPIQPYELLLYVNERIRLAHRVDPDTGAWGRDGTIVGVSYDADTNTATMELDNRRANFDALLARLSLVTGNF